MNFILLFVLISVVLLDKFYSKRKNSQSIDKLLIAGVDSEKKKFRLKYRSIFIISALVVVVVLKLIFQQSLQDLSTRFFSINIDELLICVLVLVFYILFSIITVSKKVSKKKIIAREFLYLLFNLILIFALWFFQSNLEENYQEYSLKKSQFLKEIEIQKINDTKRLPAYDLNEFQLKKAKDLGYIIDNKKYLISKWYEVLKKSSNTSPYKEAYFGGDQDIKRIGYRSAYTFDYYLQNHSVDPSSRYGINYIPSSHIDSLKLSNPKLYNDFIDFFGPLNKLDLDEFYGASNKFYYNNKPAKISVSNYSSNDLTLEYTIGKYFINDILTENISKRRIKKYYHSYYRKSPSDTRRIIPKYSKNYTTFPSTVYYVKKVGGTPRRAFSKYYNGNLAGFYGHATDEHGFYLTSQTPVRTIPQTSRKYAGIYVWSNEYSNGKQYGYKWSTYYDLQQLFDCYNSYNSDKTLFYTKHCSGGWMFDNLKDIFFKAGGGVPSRLDFNDIDDRLCKVYNCETYSTTTGYNISLDYTETDKEKILNFPLVLNIEYLEEYYDLFSQIEGYDYSDFYFEKEIKTLGVREIEIYNKTENFYTYSLFKSLDNISLNLYEKYILLLKAPIDNKEIQYLFKNGRKVFISDIQEQANKRGITFDEYKTLASAIFSKGDINNKASFFGLVFMIGFIAYLCRLIISGIIWSILALK